MPLSLELSYLYIDWFCHDGKPSRYATLLHFLNVWMWDGKDANLFPSRQAEFLLDMVENKDRVIRANALCGVVLLTMRHGERIPEMFTDRFTHWAEDDVLKEELTEVQKFLLATISGQKMQKKVRDEVIDKMQKEQQAMRDRLGMADDEDARMEIAEEGHKRMMSYAQKLNDMVQDGVDMNLGTFASLRKLEFFQDLKNWLIDFNINHPKLQELGEKKTMADALFGHAELCDLDKYALASIVGKISAAESIGQSLPEQLANQLTGENAQAILRDERQRNAYRYTFQTLFRIFHLSPWSDEVSSPFLFGPFLTDYNSLAPMVTDNFLMESARLFISHGFYAHPAAYLRSWMHRNGQTDEALEMLAYCDKQLGENRERLLCLLELEKRHPDNMRLIRETGLSLIHEKRYEEALQRFFHLEVKENYLHDSARAIAWCSLMTGNLTRAGRYYKKLLNWEGGPSWEDLLNAGHCAWLNGDPIEASGFYSRYLSIHDDGLAAFDNDHDILVSLGLSADDIGLMRDTIAM